MKKILIGSLICANLLFADIPESINFHSIAFDNSGNALANTTIAIKVELLDSSSSALYVETNSSVTTNSKGLFSLKIGTQSPVTGVFSELDFSQIVKVKVSADLAGGTSYTEMGTQDFSTVPFAFVAKSLEGNNTTADQDNMTAIGRYNTTGNIDALFAVGNGVSGAKSDAFVVYGDGNVSVEENLTVGGKLFVNGTEITASDTATILNSTSTTATGTNALAWGSGTTASNYYTTAWGMSTTASSNHSTAWGMNTKASGGFSTAWGNGTTASGYVSTAWGENTKASENYSTAFGQGTTASGNWSTAWGFDTNASNSLTTAWGKNTTADQYNMTAIGRYNTIGNTDALFVVGNGAGTGSESDAFVVYGDGNVSVEQNLTVGGKLFVNGTEITASDTATILNSTGTTITGTNALAWGSGTTASGNYSTAWGENAIASGNHSTAWGSGTASVLYATAWGSGTASGAASTAWGTSTASGGYSTACGYGTTASGSYSTAWGERTTASGSHSTAWGYYTTADQNYMTAIGKYNTKGNINALFVVGNGTGSGSESDAFEVDTSGNITYAGTSSSSSDKRLKTNIKKIDNSIEKVQGINGVTYNWIDENKEQSTQVGVIAQDVQRVMPELVKEGNNGYLSVSYTSMVGLLVEAIKEQQKSIERLQKALNNAGISIEE